MESTDFTLEIENNTYKFNVSGKGLVSLSEGDEKINATDFGQEAPAKSIPEAEDIAKLMLFAMGKITTF